MKDQAKRAGRPVGVRFSEEEVRNVERVASSIAERERRPGVCFGEAVRRAAALGIAAMDGEATAGRITAAAQRLGVSHGAVVSMAVAIGLEAMETSASAGQEGGEATGSHVCSECGSDGATLRRDDAADEEHWFHPSCWESVMSFLSGKGEPAEVVHA